MEAKDTVKSTGDLCHLVCSEYRTATLEAKDCNGLDCEICQLQKQAEISFNAGYEQGMGECLGDKAYIQIKQEGIKEVVEWIKQNSRYELEAGLNGRELATIVIKQLQAKLKDWGIE